MRRVFIAVSLAAALTAPAGAQTIPGIAIPSIVPDIGCVVGFFVGGGHCITFTQSGTIAQVNSEIMQIRNLTTMNAQGLFNAVASQIATITQTAQANPNSSGAAAAAAAAQQAQEDAAKQQWLNGTGADASGAEQRAQIAEGNASITNSELMAGNAMQSAQIQHQQKLEDSAQQTFTNVFANAQPATVGF